MNISIGEKGYAYVRHYWKTNDNIKILYNDKADNNKCVIFASSNGVWNPNTEEGFVNKIEHKDKYEWLRWGGVENFKKVIFIRDVMKEWYVNGINSKVCNIDRLIDYLKPETKGYDLVTVGNSAGGYIATIIGIQLNASHIINFSGQNSIVKESCKQEEYPELSRWKMNLERYKYYDICGMIADSEIPVYYFYAAKCEEDINQFKRISQYENVKPFAFHTKEHGENMYPFNFSVILKMESDKFCKLQQKYNTKEICPFIFMIKTLDVRTVFRKFVPYIIYKYNYKVHRHLKNKKRTLFYKGIRNE